MRQHNGKGGSPRDVKIHSKSIKKSEFIYYESLLILRILVAKVHKKPTNV